MASIRSCSRSTSPVERQERQLPMTTSGTIALYLETPSQPETILDNVFQPIVSGVQGWVSRPSQWLDCQVPHFLSSPLESNHFHHPLRPEAINSRSPSRPRAIWSARTRTCWPSSRSSPSSRAGSGRFRAVERDSNSSIVWRSIDARLVGMAALSPSCRPRTWVGDCLSKVHRCPSGGERAHPTESTVPFFARLPFFRRMATAFCGGGFGGAAFWDTARGKWAANYPDTTNGTAIDADQLGWFGESM